MDSTNDDWFIVEDLEGLINSTRALVFNNFGKNTTDKDELSMVVDQAEEDELNALLTFEESKVIIANLLRKQNHKYTKKVRYILNDSIFLEIVSSLSDRLTSNVLNSLVNKGLVDTAYDEDKDDFIFWIKDNENNKPETD